MKPELLGVEAHVKVLNEYTQYVVNVTEHGVLTEYQIAAEREAAVIRAVVVLMVQYAATVAESNHIMLLPNATGKLKQIAADAIAEACVSACISPCVQKTMHGRFEFDNGSKLYVAQSHEHATRGMKLDSLYVSNQDNRIEMEVAIPALVTSALPILYIGHYLHDDASHS